MDAYVNIQITYSDGRIASYLLMGSVEAVAERVRVQLEGAMRHGTPKSIVLSPIHPINAVQV